MKINFEVGELGITIVLYWIAGLMMLTMAWITKLLIQAVFG